MTSKLKIPKRKVLRKELPRRKWTLRSKITVGILTAIAFISATILVFPYLPHLGFLITRPKIDPSAYQQAAKETKAGKKPPQADPQKPGNRLILPGIGVDSPIVEGRNVYVIGKNQGVWRETSTIDPTIDGNIVIAGHRFLYTARNGGWFYNLPELKLGEKIYIRWKDKVYEYEVFNTRSVLPTQIDIRDPDPSVPKKLTMYTCYPLGSTAKRFVVEAKQL